MNTSKRVSDDAEPDHAVKRSISMPKSLLEIAQAKAKSEGRSLSNHVQYLIRKDAGLLDSQPAEVAA